MAPLRQVPIPKPFHSVYLEDLFEKCTGCECDLLGEQVPYAVAKHFVVKEPVFEAALCLTCVASMQSQETQERITAFVQSLKRDLPEDFDPETYTWEDGLKACLLCAKLREDCRRYQTLGVCMQAELLVAAPPSPSPYMICEDCNEQMSKLLSKQTKDNWDRFMERITDDPPTIELDSPRFDPVFM
ncbi:MAG: hypothetical protein R3C18_19915 [Planctomycetaceae bacterium]